MILEKDIPKIVKEMNEGGEHPQGVKALFINKPKRIYKHIYVDGLGVYQVDLLEPVLIMDNEEYLNITNNGA